MGSVLKEDLRVDFSKIEDPRIQRSKKYPIEEIIFLCLFGAFLGVESWRGVALLGQERLAFLRQFFAFSNGIPSHQTIGRVFSLLKPHCFEQFFMDWSAKLNGSNQGQQIAFDGKSLRGSANGAKKALHLLNACAVDNGLSLAQLQVEEKTNEITALPEMIDCLDIKGAMVSVDALNTQKNIAAKIVEAQADYTLALKGNHKHLNQAVEGLFATHTTPSHEETEKSHGRITTRRYHLLPVDKYNLPQALDWRGLKAVGRVETMTLRRGKQSHETRYYLLSYEDVQRFAKSVRNHWGVEVMHWMLDVTFGEDACTKRKDHAPRNYSLIRKWALNVLRKFKGKLSVPLVHIKAASNSEYLKSLMITAGFLPLSTAF